jgi:molybdopterin molybdotransferase
VQNRRSADWVTVQEAVARILTRVHALGSETVGLTETLGRTLSKPIRSPIDQPPWDNSAMDGFAARTADVRGASRATPVVLRVLEAVAAGDFPSRPVGPGEATEIMTGAPIPEGADCIVRVEHTLREPPGFVTVVNDMDAGRNVRGRGEDVRKGAVVLDSGRVVRPAEIGVLAMTGCRDVVVHRRPRVAILSTGDELADLDSFDEVLTGRKIVNSNSYTLAAAVRATGGVPQLLGIARDDASSLREHLARGLETDALVTTAGASVGEHDLVKDALEALDMRLDFWRVQMRPGSPFSFGTIARAGREPLPVFGLPGNPVSALVTFEILVRPALRRMMGQGAVHPRTLAVRVAEPIESKRGLAHFLRVKLEKDGEGGWLARLTGPQGSGLMTSMAEADALLVVPLDCEGLEAGETAVAVRLAAPDDAQEGIGY